jgi:hypothetical protein
MIRRAEFSAGWQLCLHTIESTARGATEGLTSLHAGSYNDRSDAI